MGREGAENEGATLAVAAQAGQAEGEAGAYGVVQLVAGPVEFGGQRLDALLRLSDVPQRAGELDLGAPGLVPGPLGDQRVDRRSLAVSALPRGTGID
jgi:hypothetical protein